MTLDITRLSPSREKNNIALEYLLFIYLLLECSFLSDSLLVFQDDIFIGWKVPSPGQETLVFPHLSAPVDPLVEDPLVSVHHRTPQVDHPEIFIITSTYVYPAFSLVEC